MPITTDVLFKDREEILREMEDQFRLAIPDIYLGPEGNLSLLLQVMAGIVESVFQSNQVVSEDMFVITASEGALERWGEQYGTPRKLGNKSSGDLKFFGQGGTFIPAGTEVAHDPGTGDPVVYFRTLADATIPNPGLPEALTAALDGAGNITGTIEYAVSFVTSEGETIIGPNSEPIIAAANKIDLTGISVGGPGTIARKIYRQKDADEIWKLVTTLADNTTTVFEDNVLDASLGANPVAFSTAETVMVAAESETASFTANLGANSITVLTVAPDGLTAVTNPDIFAGGTDSESSFDYRQRLLRTIRAPSTGSPTDLKAWAEEIEGIESATVFPNDNLGSPQNGHVTVRVVGPNSTVPSGAKQTEVLNELQERDMANITIHVASFTEVATNVSVDVTLEEGFTLGEVTASVQLAIAEYINELDVGETLMLAGITAAVFNLPGISDVVVTSPIANQITAATSKRTAGTITVT